MIHHQDLQHPARPKEMTDAEAERDRKESEGNRPVSMRLLI